MHLVYAIIFGLVTFLRVDTTLAQMLKDPSQDVRFVISCRFPRWVEFLSHNMNASTISKWCENIDIPNYNVRQAQKALMGVCKQMPHMEQISCRWWKFESSVRSVFEAKKIQLEGFHSSDLIQSLKRVNWPTALFLTFTPIVGLYGLATTPLQLPTFILAFVTWFVFGISVTAGYHRLFAHQAYDASLPLRFAYLTLGAGAFQGSALWWCRDHRAHHRFTDTPKDPYGVDRGLFWAHIGWLLLKQDHSKIGKTDMSDLYASKLMTWQHKYYPFIAFTMGWIIPTCIAGVGWGDWRGGFLIATVLRTSIVNQCTFCINSLAHYVGEATFADERSPRDSWWLSLLTYGEGYHNFHHEFPFDYRNGIHFYDFDPSKWLIWLNSLIGTAYNLRTAESDATEMGKVAMLQKKLDERRKRIYWGPEIETLPTMTMEEMQKQCQQNQARLITIDGVIFDVAEWEAIHPGGSKFIRTYIGKDATKAFHGAVYKHSQAARHLLARLAAYRLE